MEFYFLALLILIMAVALGSGYPVAFALPGAAIITISLAAASGYIYSGNVDAFFHSGGPQQWLSAGVTNLRGVYWEVERDTLIAIPLFIFMGIMLQRSKIAEDLLVTMAQLFGSVPGGLGISVVFVGALLAATTGIVGATVVAMGLISLPAMLRNNYSPPLATGTIAASGTLGQIIPPSIVLIILADQLASATDQASSMRKALHKNATGELTMPSVYDVASTSAGEMFLGAFVPGIVLVGLYMAYILIYAMIRPQAAPAVGYDGGYDRKFLRRVLLTLVPPLALIFLVLGSIISGVATVNQAGAIGAAGAMIMAGYRLHEKTRLTYAPAILAVAALAILTFALSNFEMNLKAADTVQDRLGIQIGLLGSAMLITALIWSGWRVFQIDDTLQGVMLETAKTTSLVFIILLGAAMLTASFRAFGGEELVRDFLNSLPGGFWSKFLIVMAVIFFLGFFLDFIEIAVVVVPIVAPILLADPGANITAVWLGVMIGLNIQTSFLTPPFGFALFYLRGVAPLAVKTIQMYKGVIPFIGLQIAALIIVGLYPQLVNYLPNRVSLTSETSPPPRNPKLALCLEEYVFNQYDVQGAEIRVAIGEVKKVDLDYLPKKTAKKISKAITSAESVFKLYPQVQMTRQAVKDHSAEYRPMHDSVRAIEARIVKLDGAIGNQEKLLSRAKRLGIDGEKRFAGIQPKLDDLANKKQALLLQIPDGWAEQHKAFLGIMNEEDKARRAYNRATDSAYSDIQEFVSVVEKTSDLAKLAEPLNKLSVDLASGDAEELIARIKQISRQLNSANAASKIASPLKKIRRSLKKKPDAREKFDGLIAKSQSAYSADLAWRQMAKKKSLAALQKYQTAIRDTIGVRSLNRMPREHALYVASCKSGHRDISLSF